MHHRSLPGRISVQQHEVMAQLSQACSNKTAEDLSSYSELVTGVDSYTCTL